MDRTLNLDHWKRGCPGFRKHRRIVHRELVIDLVGVDARKALDHM